METQFASCSEVTGWLSSPGYVLACRIEMRVLGAAPLCSTVGSEGWSPRRGVERAILRESTLRSAVTLWYTGTTTEEPGKEDQLGASNCSHV